MKKLFVIFALSIVFSNCSLLISDDILVPSEGVYPPPYKVGSKVWIENKAFGMLCRDMGNSYSDNDRLRVLHRYNINMYVGQGCKILSMFRDDTFRLKALDYILPRTLKHNEDVFRLSRTFNSSLGRREAEIAVSRHFNIRMNNPYERDNNYRKRYYRDNEYVMNEADFDEFMQSFRNQTFNSEKFTFLKYASKRSVFSVEQCIAILKEFTFDDERLKVCEMIVPKIVYGNTYKLFDYFSFISSKERLKKILDKLDEDLD